jgi:hypothetical protein
MILAFGTQYIWAEQYNKPMQTPQISAKQVTISSKTMPPDPLGKKRMTYIRSKLTALGFKVGTIKKVGAKQWRASVAGWDKKRTTQSHKGIINFNESSQPSGGHKCQLDSPVGPGKKSQGSKSWDPTDKSLKRGHGMMLIEVDEDGFITFSQRNLKRMGLHANPQKMQGKFGIK